MSVPKVNSKTLRFALNLYETIALRCKQPMKLLELWQFAAKAEFCGPLLSRIL